MALTRSGSTSFYEIQRDVGRFVILGLPCGGFSTRVLTGVEDRRDLRSSLHAIYDDDDMEQIIAHLREKTLDLFRDTDLSKWLGITNPASDGHIVSMLRLASLDRYWINEADIVQFTLSY
jgi:hypothetical protein